MDDTEKTVLGWLLIVGVVAVMAIGAYTFILFHGPPTETGTQTVETQVTPPSISEIQQPTVSPTLDNSLDGVMTVYLASEDQFISQGSAFLITDEYVVTNNHVVDSGNTIYLQYRRGGWTQAKRVGTDPDTDLAVLKPETVPEYSEPLSLSESKPTVGSQVYALGAPAGRTGSVTSGIVSATDRSLRLNSPYSIPDTIQTDAELTQGNSGGPLINTQGVVVGVNSAREGSNIGFAISPRITTKVVNSLIETGDHTHPLVGILTTEMTPLSEQYGEGTKSGLVVEDTNTEEASSKLQTEPSDVIVQIDSVPVDNGEDLSSYLLRETEPGDTVTLTIVRDGELTTVDLQLQARE
jgi:S1-C subfamily serine protease